MKFRKARDPPATGLVAREFWGWGSQYMGGGSRLTTPAIMQFDDPEYSCLRIRGPVPSPRLGRRITQLFQTVRCRRDCVEARLATGIATRNLETARKCERRSRIADVQIFKHVSSSHAAGSSRDPLSDNTSATRLSDSCRSSSAKISPWAASSASKARSASASSGDRPSPSAPTSSGGFPAPSVSGALGTNPASSAPVRPAAWGLTNPKCISLLPGNFSISPISSLIPSP